MRGVNKVIIDESKLKAMYISGMSIPQVSEALSASQSTVRLRLKNMGVLRSRSDGVKLAASSGRLGAGLRGKKRVFSESHKAAIRKSARERGELNAKGTSLKPNGYVEITRGPDKFRGEHRVKIEKHLGRKLRPDEQVHHIDKCRSNNELANLQVMSHSEHMRHHANENIANRKRDDLGRFL